MTVHERRHCPTGASGAQDGERPQEKPQAAVCTAKIRTRTPTHGVDGPPGITSLPARNASRHRLRWFTGRAHEPRRDGLGDWCTPPASNCCNMRVTTPSAPHRPFRAGFHLLHGRQRVPGTPKDCPETALAGEEMLEISAWYFASQGESSL